MRYRGFGQFRFIVIIALEHLMDYLVHEQFGLVAITDHDRVDTTAMLQLLAAENSSHSWPRWE